MFKEVVTGLLKVIKRVIGYYKCCLLDDSVVTTVKLALWFVLSSFTNVPLFNNSLLLWRHSRGD